VITSEVFVAEWLESFPPLKQNLGGQKFKDDRILKTAVPRWLRIQKMGKLTQDIMKV